MSFIEQRKEGPTLVVPPRPKEYFTCNGCTYFDKAMTFSGGLNGTPLYSKHCLYPREDMPHGRSLNSGFRGEPYDKEVTPEWCPLLPKENQDSPT